MKSVIKTRTHSRSFLSFLVDELSIGDFKDRQQGNGGKDLCLKVYIGELIGHLDKRYEQKKMAKAFPEIRP
jgi:hypothetical protein